MSEIVTLILVLFACLVGIYSWFVQMEGYGHRQTVGREIERHQQTLRRRRLSFREIGDVTGKTLAEINETVGLPQSFSTVGKNVLFQWIQPGMHVALLFEYRGPKPEGNVPVDVSKHEQDFVCVRVNHQFGV